MSSTLIVTAGASAAMTSAGSVGAAALLGPLGQRFEYKREYTEDIKYAVIAFANTDVR